MFGCNFDRTQKYWCNNVDESDILGLLRPDYRRTFSVFDVSTDAGYGGLDCLCKSLEKGCKKSSETFNLPIPPPLSIYRKSQSFGKSKVQTDPVPSLVLEPNLRLGF